MKSLFQILYVLIQIDAINFVGDVLYICKIHHV